MRRRFFSEFTANEQREGLEIDAGLSAYKKRKDELTAAVAAGTERVKAQPFMLELATAPGADRAFAALLPTVVRAWHQQNQQALATATSDLAALENDHWSNLAPKVNTHADVLQAIWSYRDQYRQEPVLDPDVPSPADLNSGIYDYEALVNRELAETRTMLLERRPVLANQWLFRSAQETIEMGAAGATVAQCADELRAARAKLAALRAQVAQ